MARQQNYSYGAAYKILRESEGRKSPTSGAPGHTIQQHVGGSDSQVSDRLKLGIVDRTLFSVGPTGDTEILHVSGTSTAPIIMGPSGAMVSRKEAIDVYVSSGMYPSKKKAEQAYNQVYVLPKNAAGTFLDQQQAARALQFALNSSAGQQALASLDGGKNREFFSVVMTGWTITGRNDANKMYAASKGGGGPDMSDVTHLADFTQVMVGIDALSPDGVHLQTCYPMA